MNIEQKIHKVGGITALLTFILSFVLFFINGTKTGDLLVVAILLSIISFFYLFFGQQDFLKKNYFLIVICGIAVLIGSIFIPHTTSSDLDYYLAHTINAVDYHIDPYQTSLKKATEMGIVNNYSEKVSGFGLVTNWTYGYPFLALTKLLYRASNHNPITTMLLIKLINVVLLFGSAYIVTKINKLLENKLETKMLFFFVAFNPILIFETVVNGHNDLIAVFPLLVAILFLSKKKLLLSALFLGLALSMKMSVIFWIPLIGIYLITIKTSIKNILLYIGITVIIMILPQIIFTNSLIPAGLSQYSGGFSGSLASFIATFVRTIDVLLFDKKRTIEVINKLISTQFRFIALVFKISWVVTFGTLLIKWFIHKKIYSIEQLLLYGTIVYTLYCMIFSPQLWPWYIIWFIPGIPLLLVSKNKSLIRFIIVIYLCLEIILSGPITGIGFNFARIGIIGYGLFNIFRILKQKRKGV